MLGVEASASLMIGARPERNAHGQDIGLIAIEPFVWIYVEMEFVGIF